MKFKLTFINDPLLLDEVKCNKDFTTFKCTYYKRKDTVVFPNGILNLYTALVKKCDFTPNKLMGAMPFIKIDKDHIDKILPKSYKKDFYWKLKKDFSYYIGRKRIIRTESFRAWFKKSTFPITLLRLIANLVSKDEREEMKILSEFIMKSECIINFQNEGKIYLPKTLKELNNEKLGYFIGCSFGDGELNMAYHWKLVDGDSKDIKPCLKHMKNIKLICNELFKISFTDSNPRIRGNKCELWIANKNLCRFINFFFDMPYGKKKGKLRRPKIYNILNNQELIKIFWRGVFDSDGSHTQNGFRVGLSSATKQFLLDCKNDLNEMNIETGNVLKYSSMTLEIKSNHFKDFMKNIGFSHPRKMKTSLESLKRDSYIINYYGVNHKNIKNNHFDLRKMKGLRVIGMGKLLKSFRLKNKLYQKDLASKLNCTKNQISNWEIGKDAMPFELISRLPELSNDISKNNVRWKIGIRGLRENYCKLPLSLNEDIIEISKHVRPYNTGELRIRTSGWKLIPKIKRIFEVDVYKEETKISITNFTVAEFFRRFFVYKKQWKSMNEKEIKNLENKLSIKFN